MSVTKDDVLKTARLARLKIDEDRLDAMTDELNAILGWVDQLNEVDVDGVEPMTSPVAAKLPQRADEITDGGKQADVLANAPGADDGFFVVPKSVE